MKIFSTAIVLLLSATSLLAQPTKKKEDKIPTKAEMDAMMKQVDAAMKDLDPEAKKMMDSMGIKIPGMKGSQKILAGVSDAQLKTAWEDESRIVPAKDVARIAAITKMPLTNATLPAYLANAHSKVIAQLKPAAKAKGDEIYQMVKTNYTSPLAMGNTAASLWVIGKTQIAIYLMGKACMDNPAVVNNISNYASMLSTAGAEEMAIPLLENLNKRYPQNSTILNNLGQAWYGLGDMDKAGKYIDSTLRIAAMHPQANATKSSIEESKGNTTAAKDAAVKAIKAGYSREKEERLKKLGVAIDDKIFPWPAKLANDAFGLSDFKRPDYPKSVAECIALQPIWNAFKQQCKAEEDKLGEQLKRATETMQQMHQQRMNNTMQHIRAAQQNPELDAYTEPEPLFARQAQMEYNKRQDYWNVQHEKFGKSAADKLMALGPVKEKYEAAMDKLREADLEQTGEGKPNINFCPKYQAVANDYLQTCNGTRQNIDEQEMDLFKRQANEIITMLQYTQWPDEYEVTKLQFKAGWLHKLADANYESITQYKCAPPVKKEPGKLRDFDDINCQYHSKAHLIVGTISVDCSRMTTEMDIKFLKIGLKQDMNKETFGDQIMSGSVEIGISAGKDISAGPIKVEANVGAGVRVEFDGSGITDVILKGSAGASAGTEIVSGAEEATGVKGSIGGKGVSDVSVEVGVEGQVSLISGKASVNGTGFLKK